MSLVQETDTSYIRALMLICGWNKLSTSLYIPITIENIITMFYYNDFEWNENPICFITNDNNTIQTFATEGNYYYCQAKNILSARTYSLAKWQITINNFDGLWFYGNIGYIPHSNNENYYNHDTTRSTIELWINSCQFYHSEKSTGCKIIKLANYINVGDSFEIEFDFIKKISKFYINNKFMGIMYKKLPSQIIPIVILANSHQITTTKWELTYKKSMG